jgi:acetyl esterase/lipase
MAMVVGRGEMSRGWAVALGAGAVVLGAALTRKPFSSLDALTVFRRGEPGRGHAPTLLAQGLADALVLPTVQRRYVARLCAAGQPVDFRTFAGRDHVGLVEDDSPLIGQLLRWTQDRFRGAPAPARCTRRQE